MKRQGLWPMAFVFLMSATSAVPDGMPQNRKLWADKADQEIFIQELRHRRIPFKLDRDGGIWYPSDKVAAVDEITRSILEREKSTSAFSFEDKEDQSAFRERLEAAKIPYSLSHRLGREWVVWNKAYDDKVRPIQEAVEDEGSRRARARRGAK